jgi:hypothetical protein
VPGDEGTSSVEDEQRYPSRLLATLSGRVRLTGFANVAPEVGLDRARV